MAIITIGLSCFDQFFYINRWPKENTKNFSSDFIESGGGPCANAAWLLGLWGECVYFSGHLQNDIYGQKIIDEFHDVGVNTDYVIFNNQMLTPLASILVNQLNGSRTIITRKQNYPPRMTFEEKLKIDELITHLTYDDKKEVITILIDGHEPELSEYIIQRMPDARVVMDAGSLRESNLNLAKYTDYLVASENFACELSGIEKFTSDIQLNEALTELNKLSRGQPFITLGERGCAYLKNGIPTISPAFICNAIDTTGAGDVFHGAFTYGVHYNWHIDNIILFASLAAAISVEKKGVRESIPDLADVHNAINQYERSREKYFTSF
ncbi:carbohydrate kinase family protein [Escherichia coli]|uniref:Kinase n=3 Tax=Escherichia coli TaxID=562 RepID=A0A244B9S5_ECOLX|nr:PfkB family carbohydrate kinase [Escherichia coli]ASX08141.1 kinase [Escherichia coli]AWS64128.1 kinase [Escherichia coli]EEU9423239.1 kinase [Escherichia coli]EEU9501345.1 kinase [Escherichia coli]EEW1475815.1 kinase [Escherichia coli]